MNVLLVTQHFAPQLGGIQNQLKAVVRCFDPESILVIAPKEQEPLTDASLEKYHIIRKPFIKLFGFLFSLFSLLPQIKSFSPDIIISGHVKQCIECFVLHKITGKPYVVLVYAREIHQFSQNMLKKKILQFVLRRAKKILVISNYTKTITQAFLGAEEGALSMLHPIHEPPLSVSNEAVQRVTERYHLQSKRVLYSVSRLEERKGIDYVIKALPLIWEEFPNAVYIIASIGPYEQQLRALAQDVLHRNNKDDTYIQFIGKIDEITRAALFTLCNVYVTPSRVLSNNDAEGFGIVFLEANAYGKPVVAGDSGGVPDAVVHKETGLLVDPESISDIAESIQSLLRDPERAASLGSRGKQRAEKEFSQDIFCKQLHAILTESLN